MASSGQLLKLACLVVVMFCMVACVPKAEAAVTCGQMVSDLTPCISYVKTGGALAPACCNGVRTLFTLAQTNPDRQSVCNCLKQAINGIPYTNTNAGLAAGLPAKCSVNIPYKISPSTDCKRSYKLIKLILTTILVFSV
ncbi:hypothetical protein ACFX2I_010045 [Malus domestica]